VIIKHLQLEKQMNETLTWENTQKP